MKKKDKILLRKRDIIEDFIKNEKATTLLDYKHYEHDMKYCGLCGTKLDIISIVEPSLVEYKIFRTPGMVIPESMKNDLPIGTISGGEIFSKRDGDKLRGLIYGCPNYRKMTKESIKNHNPWLGKDIEKGFSCAGHDAYVNFNCGDNKIFWAIRWYTKKPQ